MPAALIGVLTAGMALAAILTAWTTEMGVLAAVLAAAMTGMRVTMLRGVTTTAGAAVLTGMLMAVPATMLTRLVTARVLTGAPAAAMTGMRVTTAGAGVTTAGAGMTTAGAGMTTELAMLTGATEGTARMGVVAVAGVDPRAESPATDADSVMCQEVGAVFQGDRSSGSVREPLGHHHR